jgi:hypothetical protein
MYMSPEQANGDAVDQRPISIHLAVLCILPQRQTSFIGNGLLDTLYQHAQAPPPLDAGLKISSAMTAIMMEHWRKSPEIATRI